ncbi:MAG: DegV family protein [Clostridiales bacterium]|nr:DegV family protein [Clostridiales bacterium]
MKNTNYQLVTDSNSDLPLELLKKYNIPFVPMPYTLEDEEHFYDLGETFKFKSFFEKVRNGAMPSTSTYPPNYYEELLRPYLEDGKDVLFIAFSSELSAAFSFLSAAASTLREEFPERTLRIVNTLRISAPMAVLLIEALKMYDTGKPLDEVADWVENNYKRAHGYFTVDDLNHLKRGGRISSTQAMMGSMMQVKPILTINNEGKIVSLEKAKGRKKAIRRIMELTVANAEDCENNTLIILHADCEEDANKLLDMIKVHCTFKKVYIQFIGPVIGAHCGPNTLAACFMGKEINDGD